MLSFMREQELEDSSVQKPPTAAGKIPAGNAEESQEQEYLTVAARNKSVRKTTRLLAVLFAVGLLCLLFMIKKSAPGKATAADSSTVETQLEMAIARLTGIKSEMFNRMDEIVGKFYEFSEVQQVKLNELAKNPFEHDDFLGNLRRITDKENSNADLMRQQQLRQQANQLRLLCIMQSAQGNCCMIDDKILYEGDSIRGFRVRQISDSFVRLESGNGTRELGHEIILKLSE